MGGPLLAPPRGRGNRRLSPTEIHDPARLFGADAVLDLRQLKRAYAALIRAYGPESHPEVFEHVRRLYEEAREALERGDEPGKPAPSVEDDELVAARVRQCAPEDLDALAEWLEVRALTDGSTAAAVTRLALFEARSPTGSVAWLTRLAGRPATRELARDLAHFLLQARTRQALCPDWPSMWGALDEPDRFILLAHLIEALLAMGEEAAAFETYRTHGGDIRRVATRSWLSVVHRLLVAPGDGFSTDELRSLQTALDAVELDLEPARHAMLQELVELRLAVRRAERDLGVPPPVLDVLRRAVGADAPTRAHLLVRLAMMEPSPYGALAHLRYFHPILHRFLERIRESISGSNAFMMRWLYEGKPPPVPEGPSAAALARLHASLDRGRKPRFFDALPPLRWRERRTFDQGRGQTAWLAIMGIVATNGLFKSCGDPARQVSASGPVLFAIVLVGVTVVLALAVGRQALRLRAARLAWRRGDFPTRAKQQLKAWLRTTGLFPHELAALATLHQEPRLCHLVAEVMADDDCDYQILGMAHVERALRAATREASGEQGADATPSGGEEAAT